MKHSLKTLSMVLAILLVCTTLVPFANANVTVPTDDAPQQVNGRIAYRPVTEFALGQEYVIVGRTTGDDGLSYAMTDSTTGGAVSVTPVIVEGRQGIRDQLDDACVWTAVARGDFICLRNNLTGKYLGSLTDVYTWDSIYGADAVGYSRGGFSMSFIGSTGLLFGFKLHFDEARCRFYLSDQQPPWNVNIYEKFWDEEHPLMPEPEPEPAPELVDR